MPFMRLIPGRHYFISIFIIGAAMFGTFSTVIYRQYTEAQHTNEWTIHYYETLRSIRVVFVDLLNMETGARGYLMTGRPEFLEPYDEGKQRLQSNLAAALDLLGTDTVPGVQKDVFIQETRQFEALLQAQVDLVRQNGVHAITPDILNAQKVAMDHLRDYYESMIDEGAADLRRQISLSGEKERQFISLLIVGTVLAVGAMFLATVIILSLMARNARTEEDRRRSEERFRTVMNGVNDGLYDYNLQDKTVYYSPAYKTMLGYSDEEHPDTLEMFRRLLHPDDVDAVFSLWRSYRQREVSEYSNVFRLRHKDGSWRWILSRGVGLWDTDGRMVRLTGTHTDITEHKNREEELRQLNEDIETFTYIASHDLRSPLVNLKGFASEMEMAVNHAKPILKKIEPSLADGEREIISRTFDHEIPEALQFIKQSVERMDVLTTAVLDLSRIGKREFHQENIDATAVVERCLSSLAYEIQKKEVDVSCGELPHVVSDPLAFEQVFSNLIDNAVKYLSPDRKSTIHISARHTGGDIVFCVEDNGRGIAQNDRHKVFEIFRRARNTGDERGVGMGLAYVKATVRKLGGGIWFESELGKGSRFYFSVPARQYITTLKEKTA